MAKIKDGNGVRIHAGDRVKRLDDDGGLLGVGVVTRADSSIVRVRFQGEDRDREVMGAELTVANDE